MTPYYLHYKENANTWSRIRLLLNLYWPVFKLTFIRYAIFPFVACVLIASIKTGASVDILDVLLNIAVTANVCICPILLAKRNYRDVCSQLPITASEKLGFLLLTFWIAFPAVMYGSLYLGQFVGNAVFGIKIPVDFLCLPSGITISGREIWSNFDLASHIMVNVLMILSIIAASLYYIVKVKKNRTLAGILSFAGMYILIIVLLTLFSALFSEFISFPQTDNASIIVNTISSYADQATLITIGTIGIVYLVKLYKRLKYSGF